MTAYCNLQGVKRLQSNITFCPTNGRKEVALLMQRNNLLKTEYRSHYFEKVIIDP